MSKAFLSEDEKFMALALELARKGREKTLPNPMVGAVLVRDGRIIGQGYHRFYGGPHAELLALKGVPRKQMAGATLYVTLEPCVFFKGKKTQSCSHLLAGSGLQRVVVAQRDPNPLVSGKGLSLLRKSGLQVDIGLLRNEAAQLNEVYTHCVTTSLPFVSLKLASSLDGRIATKTFDSRWITCEASRRFLHCLRAEHNALLTTSETVTRDDPHLGLRFVQGREPLRVVLDRTLRTDPGARVYRNQNVVVFAASDALAGRRKSFARRGVNVITVGKRFDLRSILYRLHEMGVMTVLVEAGGSLAASLIDKRLVQKLYFFIAPKLIGADGLPSMRSLGVRDLRDALVLRKIQMRTFDHDILVEGILH